MKKTIKLPLDQDIEIGSTFIEKGFQWSILKTVPFNSHQRVTVLRCDLFKVDTRRVNHQQIELFSKSQGSLSLGPAEQFEPFDYSEHRKKFTSEEVQQTFNKYFSDAKYTRNVFDFRTFDESTSYNAPEGAFEEPAARGEARSRVPRAEASEI